MAQQQSLIYSFVARGTVILVEFTDFKGNFTSVAAQCLQKLPSSNNKFTYTCDGHTFSYLVEDGFSTRLQNNGDTDEKKDVASEHEDKTHSSRHHCRTDSHNRALSLPWLQVLKSPIKVGKKLS
ncbi:hypothetical protein F2Q68_00042788 [Brassica cretica]|uniref:Longin domain-containing protein n=1 Tax=Brassica cretica TaxID=69181 RepID=A0A8S9MLP7_BRACR|nr:hypothetical protein F2Q68_00042788 [Brassica cretica]